MGDDKGPGELGYDAPPAEREAVDRFAQAIDPGLEEVLRGLKWLRPATDGLTVLALCPRSARAFAEQMTIDGMGHYAAELVHKLRQRPTVFEPAERLVEPSGIVLLAGEYMTLDVLESLAPGLLPPWRARAPGEVPIVLVVRYEPEIATLVRLSWAAFEPTEGAEPPRRRSGPPHGRTN